MRKKPRSTGSSPSALATTRRDYASGWPQAPSRVLVIGGGFIGCEVASVCRELGLPVTLVERGPAPLVRRPRRDSRWGRRPMQRHHGVDLRTGVTVMALEGDEKGRLRRAHLSDGDVLDAEVAVAALGARPQRRVAERRRAGGRRAGGGVRRVVPRLQRRRRRARRRLRRRGRGALAPPALRRAAVGGRALGQRRPAGGDVAAHNMVRPPAERRAHRTCPPSGPTSSGSISSRSGCPPSPTRSSSPRARSRSGRFVAVFGGAGRVVAAVAFNAPRWLEFYRALIEARAPFPPPASRHRRAGRASSPVRPAFPPRGQPTHSATIVATGPGPCTPESAAAEPGAAAVPPRRRWKPSKTRACRPDHLRSNAAASARPAPEGGLRCFTTTRSRPRGAVLRSPRTGQPPQPLPALRPAARDPGVSAGGRHLRRQHLREIAALLHDPRISSDKRKSARDAVSLAASGQISSGSQAASRPSSSSTRPTTTGSVAC